MGDGKHGSGEEAQQARAQQTQAPSADVALLIRIRRGEDAALREFMRLFQPLLLNQARRLGIERSERDTVVTAFLDDILVKLARMQAPRSLAIFVIQSFRNHVADNWRSDAARNRRDTSESDLIGGEHVVTATCSAFSLSAALGPEVVGGVACTNTVLPAAALINGVMRRCTHEERSMLLWSSQRVPMREVATWLGISYSAARQRHARLRAHLARESIRYLPNLEPADRAAITRLLRRAGVKIDDGGQNGGVAA